MSYCSLSIINEMDLEKIAGGNGDCPCQFCGGSTDSTNNKHGGLYSVSYNDKTDILVCEQCFRNPTLKIMLAELTERIDEMVAPKKGH